MNWKDYNFSYDSKETQLKRREGFASFKNLLNEIQEDQEKIKYNSASPVIVNGKKYSSISAAGRDLNMTWKDIINRIKARIPGYYFISK